MKKNLGIICIIGIVLFASCQNDSTGSEYSYTFRNYSSHIITITVVGEDSFDLEIGEIRTVNHSSSTFEIHYSPEEFVTEGERGVRWINFVDR